MNVAKYFYTISYSCIRLNRLKKKNFQEVQEVTTFSREHPGLIQILFVFVTIYEYHTRWYNLLIINTYNKYIHVLSTYMTRQFFKFLLFFFFFFQYDRDALVHWLFSNVCGNHVLNFMCTFKFEDVVRELMDVNIDALQRKTNRSIVISRNLIIKKKKKNFLYVIIDEIKIKIVWIYQSINVLKRNIITIFLFFKFKYAIFLSYAIINKFAFYGFYRIIVLYVST